MNSLTSKFTRLVNLFTLICILWLVVLGEGSNTHPDFDLHARVPLRDTFDTQYTQNILYNQNYYDYLSTNDSSEIYFYTHGDYSAVNAMKLDFSFKIFDNQFKTFGIGLKNDIGSRKYVHACASLLFSLAVTELDDRGIQDIIFFGQTGFLVGETFINSKPRVIWSVDSIENGEVKQLECGSEHAFIRTSKNRIFAFGSNHNFNQLGAGKTVIQFSNFLEHTKIRNVTHVSTSDSHSIFIIDDGDAYANFVPKYNFDEIKLPDQPYINITFSNPEARPIIHASASSRGGILVGNDNCLYIYGCIFNLNCTGNDTITAKKVDIFGCNHQKVFVSEDGSNAISIQSDNTIIEYSNLNDAGTLMFFKFSGDISEISFIQFYNNASLIAVIQLQNGSVLALDDYKFHNLEFIDNSFIRMPNSSSLKNSSAPINSLQCSFDHCVIIGQDKLLYTVGNGKLKTCNYLSSDVSHCDSNDNKLLGKVYAMIPYYSDDCNIAIFHDSAINDTPNQELLIKSCSSSIGDVAISAHNYYFPRENYLMDIVYSSISFGLDNADLETDPLIFSTKSKNNLQLNITVFNETNNDPEISKVMNSFNDFQHVSIIASPLLSSKIYAVYHIARYRYSKALAIVELDQYYKQARGVKLFENVVYYWIVNNPPPFSFIERSLIYILNGDYSIFVFKLTEEIIEYVPTDNSIKSHKFSKIISDLSTGHNAILLSKDNKVFEVKFYENRTYNIYQMTFNFIENEKIVHLEKIKTDIYVLTNYSRAYYSKDGDSNVELLPAENISVLQRFSFLRSNGVLLYPNITCNGVAADSLDVCNGHGECTLHNHCICIENYYGNNCQTQKNFNCFGYYSNQIGECSGNGICHEQNVCECKTFYSSNDCSCFGIYLFGTCITYFIFLIIPAIIFADIIIVILIVFLIVLFISLIRYQFIQKRKLQRSDKLIGKMARDYEMGDVFDDVRKSWDLNKKLFQIPSSEINIVKKIGSGGEGVVYSAKWKSFDVAIKYYNCKLMSENEIFLNYKKESEIMTSLRHPNIVTFYGATLSFPRIGFIMEYYPRSVYQFIENGEPSRVPKEKLINMLLDVCNAMIYLHSHNVIHRDLKWQNVLMTDDFQCKVSDFGLTNIKDSITSSVTHIIGTSYYVAPENFNGLEYDNKVDVYAFGFMIFELLLGITNSWSLDDSTKDLSTVRISALASQNANFRPNIDHLSKKGYFHFSKICKSCWEHKPEDRPNFEQLHDQIRKFYSYNG